MNLRPDDARKLANALLDSDPGVDAASGGGDAELAAAGGRLVPGPFGRYRITRLVGVGGMGEVYEAEQENPARKVAIKVVRPELISSEVLRRFEHETRVLARLQHPGIAPIYEAGRVEDEGGSGSGMARRGMPFFAMEFVDGTPLTSFAADRKLSLKARLELFLLICDAVEHAHRKGVIHRDLKPGNLLVDGAGRPRVMDFGLARATDADIRATTMHTEIGKLVGTLPYMSPEQVGGDPDALDTRSDVYSLGVVLYELLGGRLPYALKTDGRARIPEAVRAIQESEPAPLSSTDRSFRGDLDTIVAKALAKERERRYQSVGELAADIRRYLNDEPIVARRAGMWYQVRKFGRRNKGVATFVMISVFTLSLAAVFSGWMAVRQTWIASELRDAREAESAQRRLAEARQLHAEDEASVSNEITRFLERMFASIQPLQDGRDVRVVDILERALEELSIEDVSSPRVQARLQHALGTAFMTVGDYEQSEQLLTSAVVVAEDAFGPTAEETLRAKSHLGLLLRRRERLEEALALANEVLLVRSEQPNVKAQLLAEAMVNVGVIQVSRRQFEEAGKLLQEACSLADAHLDPSHHISLAAHNSLASVLYELGHLEDAEALFHDVLARRLERFGPEHPDTVNTRQHLIGIMIRRGRFDEAIHLQQEDIEALTRAHGPRHPDTLQARENLAGYLFEAGRPEQTIPIIDETLAGLNAVLGVSHPRALGSRALKARALRSLNRLDEAVAEMAEVVRLADAAAVPRDDIRGIARRNYGYMLKDAGDFIAAESNLLESITMLSATLGLSDRRTQDAIEMLALLYEEHGHDDKAAEARGWQTAPELRR